MLKESPSAGRQPRTEKISADLVVVGGGLAGTCCAITAARAGIRVVLIGDRPVLGGNASSEVRLWVLGATSHMGNNNRWAREGGVIDEILIENLYRNPEGNPLVFDTVLLEKAISEPNIRLLLNTVVHDLRKHDADTISSVRAFCSQNGTAYEIEAPLFCDASGDGIVGFLAGAAFRMGAESKDEFGEKFAPTKEYGELLGHSLYFYSKDTGRPVKFTPPAYALADIRKIPRFRQFNTQDYGCRLWWIEYGGRLDTVHDTEAIKWELWKVVYGVWNYIKNSGRFPEAQNLTLEWVGQIPGKRESRRFEGDYMLVQQDVVEQRGHADDVSYGGWSIDLHPADGIFSEKPGCNQWHSKGVYPIPYRCMYSRNIRNLFLAGRIVSASHVAFGSSRVMATAAHGAQAVGMAAALCRAENLLPADLVKPEKMTVLQRELVRSGQFIPNFSPDDPEDLARTASVSASSRYRLGRLPGDGPMLPLKYSWAMLLPLTAGPVPKVTFRIDAAQATKLRVELRTSARLDNYTPDVTLDSRSIAVSPGNDVRVVVAFDAVIDRPRYAFICLMVNEHVSVRCSEHRVTGLLAVTNRFNPAVAIAGEQTPPEDIGVESFEFWPAVRRPGGHNIAMQIDPPLDPYEPANVCNGIARPTTSPNAWVADPVDSEPKLTLKWDRPQTIARIELAFDTDFDHPAESVLMGHPETVMPFCVQRYEIRDGLGNVLATCNDNHQTRNSIRLASPVTTDRLSIRLWHPSDRVPAALFEVRCYSR
jgi:hypothetical protein